MYIGRNNERWKKRGRDEARDQEGRREGWREELGVSEGGSEGRKGRKMGESEGDIYTKVCNWRYGAQCSASLCFEAPGRVIVAPSCKLRSQRACALQCSPVRPRLKLSARIANARLA